MDQFWIEIVDFIKFIERKNLKQNNQKNIKSFKENEINNNNIPVFIEISRQDEPIYEPIEYGQLEIHIEII